MPIIGAVAGVAGAAIGGTTGAIIGAAGTAASGLMASNSAKKAGSQQAAGVDAATKLQADIYNQNREDMQPWRTAGGQGLAALQYGLGLSNPYAEQAQYSTPDSIKAAVSPYYASNTAGTEGKQIYYNPTTGKASMTGGSGFIALDGVKTVLGKPDMTAFASQIDNASKALPAPTTSADSGPAGMTFGGLMKNYTGQDLYTDPSYKFRLDEGMKALERSGAARGGLLSGGMAKDLTNYAQGAASTEYMNAYNRFNTDRDAMYNKLANLSGVGQAASASLAAQGNNYADNAGSLAMAKGQIQANTTGQQQNIIGQTLGQIGTNWSNSNSMPTGLGNPMSSGWSSNPYSGSNIRWN